MGDGEAEALAPRADDAGARTGTASWWLPVGLLAFGFMIGTVTGLSKTSGISQALLTGAFTFIGGAFLSYAGFRRGPREPSVVDTVAVGRALTLFSVGTLLGAVAGYGIRNGGFKGAEVDADSGAHPAPSATRPSTHPIGISLENDALDACDRVTAHVVDGGFVKSEEKQASGDAEALYAQFCQKSSR
jgi:hypothetical protein